MMSNVTKPYKENYRKIRIGRITRLNNFDAFSMHTCCDIKYDQALQRKL